MTLNVPLLFNFDFPSCEYITQHPRTHEAISYVLAGVAIGLIIITVLSVYPGEPFESSVLGPIHCKQSERESDRRRTQRHGDKLEEIDVKVTRRRTSTSSGAHAITSEAWSYDSSGGIHDTSPSKITSIRHDCAVDNVKSHFSPHSTTRRCGCNGQEQQAQADALHRLLLREDRVWQQFQRLPRTFQSTLGLSESQVRAAIRQEVSQAEFEVRQGAGSETFPKDTGVIVDPIGFSMRVNLAFYLIAFGALVYFIDMEYGYAATCLFTRWFPKEAEVLGFKSISEKS